MKKFFALSIVALLTTGAFANPNEKVLRSFEETFSTASQVKWQEYSDFYTVSFVYSGIRSRVNYDKNGNILRTIRYYQPSFLPLNIYTRLMQEQKSRKLFGVTEVSEGDQIAYFVKVETAKHWLTLKVDANGNSEIVERYRKA